MSATFDELVPEAREAIPRLRDVLALPRGEQLEAILSLRSSLPPAASPESWNTSFGPGSLFDAWTRSPLTRSIYAHNRDWVRRELASRSDWHVAEAGGGDGRLWHQVLDPSSVGRLTVIDPHDEPHACVARLLPDGVRLSSQVLPVEQASLTDVDVIVCSLTLHHVAGRDREERRAAGFEGPGKLEVLKAFAEALRDREGLLLLNEADIYCDLALPPGDDVLADHLVDSYVRRCARALLDAIAQQDVSDDLRARWWTIIRRWCLDQVDAATVTYARRDVYELDVPRWRELLDAAGFELVDSRFTDRWRLFHAYVCRPRA